MDQIAERERRPAEQVHVYIFCGPFSMQGKQEWHFAGYEDLYDAAGTQNPEDFVNDLGGGVNMLKGVKADDRIDGRIRNLAKGIVHFVETPRGFCRRRLVDLDSNPSLYIESSQNTAGSATEIKDGRVWPHDVTEQSSAAFLDGGGAAFGA